MGFFRLLFKSYLYGTFLLLLGLSAFILNLLYTKLEVPDSHWDHSTKVNLEGLSWSKIKTNGVELSVLEAGPKEGPLVILLHGFPQTALLTWHNQIPYLAKAGYHVVAPDQRGYNTSSKPSSLDDYKITHLVDDIIGLIDHFVGKEHKAIVAGHDWGAAVAWWIAMKHPERVERLAILNVPHPVVFKSYLFTHPSQLLKSWYIFFFQLPILPELRLTKDNFAMGRKAMAGSKKPISFDAIQRHIEAWSIEGEVTSMLNYYRATLQRMTPPPDDITIKVPTLIIWGKLDTALEYQTVPLSLEKCPQGRAIYYEDASHWVTEDKPEEVANDLLNFFKEK